MKMRTCGSLRLVVVGAFSALFAAASVRAETYTWIGGAGYWKDGSHWQSPDMSTGTAPRESDAAVIPSSNANFTVTVDEPFTVGSLEIGAEDDAPGTVTLNVMHLGTNVVKGSARLYKRGKMTHNSNEKVLSYKLNLEVGGDMTLDASSEINVDGKGYGGSARTGNWGGSYGGYSYGGSITKIYGSIREPVDLGTCGKNTGDRGGGAVYLDVTGTLTVQSGSTISACSNASAPAGSGGSVLLKVGTLAGAGTITASSGNVSSYSGGGGRLAVHQRTASDWSAFAGGKLYALGGKNHSYASGPGTVYKKLPGQEYGDLIITGNDRAFTATDQGSCAISTNVVDHALPFDSVTLSNNARLQLGAGVTLRVAQTFDSSSGWMQAQDATAGIAFVGTNECMCAFGPKFDVKQVTCKVPGKRLKFSTSSAKKLVMPDAGTLTLHGTEAKPLELYPEQDGGVWYLGLNPNTVCDIFAVAVTNSTATGKSVTAISSVDLGGNIAWLFTEPIVPGQTIVWTGGKSSSWDEAGNWDRNRTPENTDAVRIPKITAETACYPVISNGAKLMNELQLDDGAKLTLVGGTYTVTNDLQIHGEILMSARATLSFSGNASFANATFACNDARLRLIGDGDQTFNPSGVSLDYLIVAKSGGSVSFADGFTANDWRVDAGAPLTLLFAPGASVTAHTMYLNGFTPGATNLVLRGSVRDSAWSLRTDPLRQSVTGVCVRDCAASADAPIRADGRTCVNEGNNANWLFESAVSRWAGGEGLFSDATKWFPNEVPGEGCHVAIVAGEGVPATVTLAAGEAVPLASLTVSGADGALAKFTANAPIAVAGGMEVMTNATLVLNSCDEFNTVGGNVRLHAGATLTHDGPQATMTKRLRLQVTGDMMMDAGSKIDVDCKGSNVGTGDWGGSHGGYAYGGNITRIHGSIREPVDLGSHGKNDVEYGGGAVYLDVAGTLTVQSGSTISACGSTGKKSPAGSGGSVLLKVGTLAGAGTITASSGNAASYSGGGGRLAVHQRTASDWSAFAGGKLYALGGKNHACAGGPGTVYKKLPGQEYGDLIITGNDKAFTATDQGSCAISTNVVDHALPFDSVTLSNNARLQLGAGVTLRVAQTFDSSSGWMQAQDATAGIAFVGTNECMCAFGPKFDVKQVTCRVPGKRLKFSTSSAKKLVMPDAGTLILRGSPDNKLVLQSETPGVQWSIIVPDSAQTDLRYLMVTDSNASGGKTLATRGSGIKRGNNLNWLFPAGMALILK